MGKVQGKLSMKLSELKSKNVIIYGAGNAFLLLKPQIKTIKPYLILDSRFKRGNMIDETFACSLSEYTATEEEKENAIVLIMLGKKSYIDEARKSLKAAGFKNIIKFYEIEDLYFNPLERFTALYNNYDFILKDALSCAVFNNLFITYLQRAYVPIPSSPEAEQYLPSDISIDYSRIIHCGAYDGDTIRAIQSKHIIQALAAFEPDEVNFNKLIKSFFDTKTETILFPCGAYDGETQVRFNSLEKSSAIAADGEYIIQCVAIDHVLPSFKPTYITMDIEGAELEALKGAENTIKKYKPALAICVYHKQDHLWKIPQYIHSLGLNYKLYLRNYTGCISETVLYAVKG